MKRYLLVTIDTEEEGLWNGVYSRIVKDVRSAAELERLRPICDRYGVRPTYLVDYPVATCAASRSYIRGLARSDDCEIGAHLHPWCNPPFDEALTVRNTFPNNLPPELEERKLEVLTDAIAECTGKRPQSYRAGRFGCDAETLGILERLGYKVDSSVTPLRRETDEGGPDFMNAPTRPYHPSQRDIRHRGGALLLEVPTSIYWAGILPQRLAAALLNSGDTHKVKRRLGRLRLGRWVWFRPSATSIPDLRLAVETAVRRGDPVLNMMFHSTELLAGASPYARSDADVEQLIRRVESAVCHAVREHGCQPATLSELPGRLRMEY